jgi:hypothetical protein
LKLYNNILTNFSFYIIIIYKMNFLLGIVIAALFMILLVSIVNETVESFRGRRGRGRRGGRRGGWRRGFNPNRYLRRFRHRNNWWGHRGWYGSHGKVFSRRPNIFKNGRTMEYTINFHYIAIIYNENGFVNSSNCFVYYCIL